jgi:glycosyltransferase involved in cell wall biosynthesis
LTKCLNSVIDQTFTDFEVICVNDGSTDGGLVILQDFEKKFSILNSQLANADRRFSIIDKENGGLSDARNTGIKAAKGDYIFLLDSDDWISENALEILNKNINNQDFIEFNGERFFENAKTEIPDKGISEPKLTGWEYYNKYALKSRKFHFVCTVLRIYRREFLLKNELFFKKGIFHEDALFTPVCCYYAENIKVIPDILYVYRIREGSITSKPNIQRNIDIVKIANILSEFFILSENINKSVIYRQISNMYFSGFVKGINKLLPDLDKVLKQNINWKSFKSVSIYPRHKFLYRLLKINPKIFRLYIEIEIKIKQICRL